MSCTENESGPFVVFFLPAVVGCLTILLARRWANSQVNSTSSTAVSRRRKIIKDPIKRPPLPLLTCNKMVQPGAKKLTTVTKKSFYPEEEITSNGKKLSRPRYSPPSGNGVTSDFKLSEGPLPPKHIPFPYIPQDGELLFEAMTFVFTLVATGLQFLNLYRTAWWLPHSYTNQAMNFYLIDPHLVAFIVVVISRRLLLSLSLALLQTVVAPKLMPHATVAARMFILGVVLGALAWCTYFLMLKHSLAKLFYLCYPAVIYFLLFGFKAGPFLSLVTSECPVLHCCSHVPQQLRTEADAIRQDFNSRLNRILFNSVVGAYYSSFIPCCFAQPYLYYDVYAASQQTAFVCGALCGRYGCQLLNAGVLDVAHRAAKHLGRWRQDTTNIDTGCEVSEWSPNKVFTAGTRVSANGAVYVADTSSVVAAPGDAQHARFYSVFSNPSTLLCGLLCLQLSLIVLQLCLLFSSLPWHNFLSTVILLFINYYTLFKMVRDYLIAWKVYKAESMIQERNGSIQSLH